MEGGVFDDISDIGNDTGVPNSCRLFRSRKRNGCNWTVSARERPQISKGCLIEIRVFLVVWEPTHSRQAPINFQSEVIASFFAELAANFS
jgi:hypothetical protein